ncbi:hypothetical protein MKW92_011003, partial [Papaver armeniacum]
DENDSSDVHLGRLLQILREFTADPILITYVIDDVWDYMKAMKDWKFIVSMLLDEKPGKTLRMLMPQIWFDCFIHRLRKLSEKELYPLLITES